MNNLAPAGKLEIENKIKSKRKKEERKLIPVQDLILIHPKLKNQLFILVRVLLFLDITQKEVSQYF